MSGATWLHPLAGETCLEWWERRKRHDVDLRRFRERTLENESRTATQRRRRQYAEDEQRRPSSSDNDLYAWPSSSFSADPAPAISPPEPPASIDPGGGSPGGAGASGDY